MDYASETSLNQKAVMFTNKVIDSLIFILLLLGILYAGYALWDSYDLNNREKLSHDAMMAYKPSAGSGASYTLLDAMTINPDVIAWLEIDNTQIDYLVVQGEDNMYYLNKDAFKNYSIAGALFLDYRNASDFTDFNSIVFGHNMKNGSMFGDLKKFKDKKFFSENTSGTLYLLEETHRLEIFAYLTVNAYGSMVFKTNMTTEDSQMAYLDYLCKNAVNYRDIGLSTDDRLLTMSTCAGDFTNARSILVARICD